MNEHIPCDLIQDVLPLYIEKLLSEQSESLVNEHLISCDCCREKYQLLSKTLPEESGGMTKQEMCEIDYLKKINSYQRNTRILGFAVSFLFGMLLPLAIMGIKVIFAWNGNIPEYVLARFQAAWHIGVVKMLISGVISGVIYLFISYGMKRIKK